MRVSSPDKYRLLDTEFTRVQLEAHKTRSSADYSLVCKEMTKRVCDQNDKVRREGRRIGFEVEHLRGRGAHDAEHRPKKQDS